MQKTVQSHHLNERLNDFEKRLRYYVLFVWFPGAVIGYFVSRHMEWNNDVLWAFYIGFTFGFVPALALTSGVSRILRNAGN
jgi:hypothetical protein